MRLIHFLVLATCALASPLVKRAPLPPAQDPFYRPPAGYQSLPRGSIIRVRQIQPAFSGVVPAITITAYQLLYVSTQANGTKMATVTTVFKPVGARTDLLVTYSTYAQML